jgi:hypothetical protein
MRVLGSYHRNAEGLPNVCRYDSVRINEVGVNQVEGLLPVETTDGSLHEGTEHPRLQSLETTAW